MGHLETLSKVDVEQHDQPLHESHSLSDPQESFRQNFQNLDQAENPQSLLGYLDSFADLASVRAYKEESFRLLRLQPGQSVLDVGCGSGDDARALAELVGGNGRVVGLDASEVAITEAVRRSAGSSAPLEFQTGDVHDLHFASEEFHAVRADRVFQHVEDPERALGELMRVTRRGGLVNVAEPDWDTLIVDSNDQAVTRQIVRYGCDAIRNGWIGRKLRSMFLDVGFEDVKVSGIVIILTNLALADRIFGLTDIAHSAADAGVITGDQAMAWLDALRRSDRTGRVFVSATGYLVVGRKPS